MHFDHQGASWLTYLGRWNFPSASELCFASFPGTQIETTPCRRWSQKGSPLSRSYLCHGSHSTSWFWHFRLRFASTDKAEPSHPCLSYSEHSPNKLYSFAAVLPRFKSDASRSEYLRHWDSRALKFASPFFPDRLSPFSKFDEIATFRAPWRPYFRSN